MRPGVKKAEYERLIRIRMAAELVNLGLLTQAEVDAQKDDPLCVRRYYMHSTSHPLGDVDALQIPCLRKIRYGPSSRAST